MKISDRSDQVPPCGLAGRRIAGGAPSGGSIILHPRPTDHGIPMRSVTSGDVIKFKSWRQWQRVEVPIRLLSDASLFLSNLPVVNNPR